MALHGRIWLGIRELKKDREAKRPLVDAWFFEEP
jgi:hypothetical protein